jgi:hypothetical protein
MKHLLLLLITTFSLSAQIRGVVKDSISGQPISYVNIWVENENIGTTSEENGVFSLDIKEEKVLVFSALGYETKKVSSKKQTIFLKPIAYELNEVVVENKKGTNEIKIGKYKKNKINLYYGAGIQPTILAKKIEFTHEIANYPYIKEINFLTRCDIKKAKIILRFFELDLDEKPGKDYLDEVIIIEVKKGKQINIVELEKFNIKIPKEGIYIAFEWMIVEENKYTYEYTLNEENNKIKYKDGVNYQPIIGTIPSDKATSWNFSKGSWFARNKHTNGNLTATNYIGKFGELAIQITLTN